jgi:hypothetical protein
VFDRAFALNPLFTVTRELMTVLLAEGQAGTMAERQGLGGSEASSKVREVRDAIRLCN